MILLWKVPTRRSFFKWRVCRPSAWLRGPKSSPPLFDVWILLLSAKQTNEYVISAERFSQYLHTYLLCIVTSRSDLIRWCSLSIVRYLPTYLPSFEMIIMLTPHCAASNFYCGKSCASWRHQISTQFCWNCFWHFWQRFSQACLWEGKKNRQKKKKLQ